MPITIEPELQSLGATTTALAWKLLKATHPRTHALQKQKPSQWEAHAPQWESSLHSLQLEEKPAQQQRPSTAKNKYNYIKNKGIRGWPLWEALGKHLPYLAIVPSGEGTWSYSLSRHQHSPVPGTEQVLNKWPKILGSERLETRLPEAATQTERLQLPYAKWHLYKVKGYRNKGAVWLP